MREERKKIWIDEFQTRLALRMVFYWVVSAVTVWNLLFCWRLLQEGPGDVLEQYFRFFQDFYPGLILPALILPFVMWDAIRFSHRLVGPLVRFRRVVQALSAGESVPLIKLRKGDYLTELRDEFNAMLESLQQQGIAAIHPAVPDTADNQRQTA